jgi:hypothetical protein
MSWRGAGFDNGIVNSEKAITNGQDLQGRAQKPSATFLGENVAWEKTTVS